MSCVALSLQRAPLSSVSCLRAASQTCSESTSTPSRSKITALIFPLMFLDYLRCAVYSRSRLARRRQRVLPDGDAISYGLYHLGAQVYGIGFHPPKMPTAATLPQAAVREVRWCNRAATEAGRTRTEQESNSAKNGKNCLDKLDFPTGQYLPYRLQGAPKPRPTTVTPPTLIRGRKALSPLR